MREPPTGRRFDGEPAQSARGEQPPGGPTSDACGGGPSRRAVVLSVAAVALVAFLAAAAGIPGRATYGAQVSGDEPHYLLTAISLGEDAGLDISDEVAAERYRPFHEVDLLRQAVTRPDGSRVVPHDPLLPLLLALPVRLGGWVGAKLALAAVAAALAALTVWTAVWRFSVPLGVAAAVTTVFAASAPLAVYGQQVYPELPAALAATSAVAALTGQMRHGGQAVLGLAVVALPWLAVKYIPVAATLAVLGALRLWRQGRRHRATRWIPRVRAAGDPRAAVTFLAVMAVAGGVYVAAHLAWYGGLTVYAAGDFFRAHGGQLSVIGTDPNYLGRARRLIGLLVGRSFGLAAWQPAWLLVVPALAALLRRRPAGWAALVTPLAVAWLVATFVALTMQGWWFPGRQVVVVLPLAVLMIARWAGERRPRADGGEGEWCGSGERAELRGLHGKLVRVLRGMEMRTGKHPGRAPGTALRSGGLALTLGLGAIGVWSYGWLAAQAAAGRLTWIVDFYATADPWYRAWRLALPDYLDVSLRTWLLQGLWLAVLAAAAGWAWHRAGRACGRTPS